MLNKPVSALSGIGNARAKLFARLGIYNVADLLLYFPRDYEDRTKIVPIFEANDSETVCIKATVFSAVSERRINKSLSLYNVDLVDESGKITATWFNNKYIKNSIVKGDSYTFYGKIKKMGSKKFIENPIFEKIDTKQLVTGKIVPIYPLTADLAQKTVQKAIASALEMCPSFKETLPRSLIEKYNLLGFDEAVRTIHFPSDFDSYSRARRRLVFDELLTLSLALSKIKTSKTNTLQKAHIDTSYTKEFVDSLPFSLTNAQKKVIDEICDDLSRSVSMNRLVQGDVGSGKTVVAAAAMYACAKSGYQSALMVPTEVLAKQHYENFKKMMDCHTINVCLLVGSMSAKEKRQAYEDIKSGYADIIIGTHAMIQEGVIYKSLALVITDEQHRFGVIHRDSIAQKGDNPHVLVMSATPIPRTLALILYGDLDISIIDELPPGRKNVLTYCVDEKMRERIFAFIKKHVLNGRQIYIVCPLIEETENSDLKNVIDYADMLRTKIFPEFRCALLHGKLKSDEKENIMTHFKAGEIDILISTTVIEVGVDVANANVMIVENAERFGVSQLHQLRGRVGRGAEQSYCILFNQGEGEIAKKRMQIMCSSNDGFYISEQDLRLRGPGDFFGTKQHGLPTMRIANLFNDMDILKEVQKAVSELFDSTLHLTNEETNALEKKISLLTDRILL